MAKDATKDAGRQPGMRWWQWALMYPTLLVAVVSAVPTWTDALYAVSNEISVTQVGTARDSQRFWKKAQNVDCSTAPFDWVRNPSNILVDGTICSTGDVLIRIDTPSSGSFLKPILLEDLISSPQSEIAWLEGWAVGAARAATGGAARTETSAVPRRAEGLRMAQQAQVLRSYMAADKRTLIRVIKVGSRCFEEHVDTLTGRIEETRDVPCS